MFTKSLSLCKEILAGDRTVLRELLHPARDPAPIGYSLAHAKLPAGAASLPHRLRSSELYYFVSGQGRMSVDDTSTPVAPEQIVYVPPGAVQFVENLGASDLVFLCIVEPAWRGEDEDVLKRNS